jgi:uncharacterized OB-fold protein
VIPNTGRVVACDRERHQVTVAIDLGRCGGCGGGHCARRERTIACFIKENIDVNLGQRVAVIAPRGSARRAFAALLGGPVVVALVAYPLVGTVIAIGAAAVSAAIGAFVIARLDERPTATLLRAGVSDQTRLGSQEQTDIQTDV